ncbi:extracellular solute-binding protein [Lactobacillus crispatus]|uniref:Extracellular solute-binding protein n=1 Tax=Lactobacillus crispatus TaxID=47770 RepID=A0A5M9Z2V9_9LACO|nr:extracellular solute-binding protein [Lactobacillus crispatus]KAA8813040.1 extracellular solute-binding protein [Lactobacillus crispatus]MBW9142841.1 extracellular solute-binding protein [Lactobacillus crispatus]ORE85588.1 ABC transporter substrate-binding protein [Lactobacillus crispatus]QWW28587.1 extracellular solute-binding protein [Lactobacillus crispatus]
MKFYKKLVLTGAAALAVLGLSACSNNNSSSSSSNKKIPTKINKKTTVTFWYSLTGNAQSSLQKLTKDFEKKNPNITIKLQSQGGNYSDLQSKLVSGLQSPKDLPTITQAYPGWLYNAAKNNMLVNLTPYINNSEIGWGSYAKSGIKKSLWNGANINGTQYGVPFNKSVEVLFYNKTLLDKYDVKVPTNMSELASASAKIYRESHHKVRGVGFDALNNYYMMQMKETYGKDFNKNLNFAAKDSVKAINYYANGVRAGYFMQAGTEKYMSTPFNNGRVAMFIGSTANEAYLKQGLKKGYTYGVAARPSTMNVQQGTDIYMLTAMQKSAAFKYLKFLTSKSSQLYWAKQTGYMPVNTAAINDKVYQSAKNSKIPAIIAKTSKNLYFLPVTKNATAAYDQVNANMQTILAKASKKQSWNSDIKTGKDKLDAAWKQ